MPIGGQYDFQLNKKGYLLVRSGPMRGRAWRRTGSPNTPGRQTSSAMKFGELPGEIEHVELWEDWSAGFGFAYRDYDVPNGYHWGENFDPRWPGQLCHAMVPVNVNASGVFSLDSIQKYPRGVEFFLETTASINGGRFNPPGAVGVNALMIGLKAQASLPTEQGAGIGIIRDAQMFYEQPPSGTPPVVYNALNTAINGSLHVPQKAALFGSFVFVGLKGPEASPANAFARLDQWSFIGTLSTFPGRGLHNAGNKLWRFHGPSGNYRNLYLQALAANGSALQATQWTATLSIGNQWNSISDLTSLNDQLFAGMQDGIYAGDSSGTFRNITPGIVVHEDNFRDLAIHDNKIIGQHRDGIVQYDPQQATLRPIYPPIARSPRASLFNARPRALRSFGPWLYAGQYEGSTSYLMVGRDASPGLPFVWHPMQRLPTTTKVHRLFFDTIPGNAARMWIATDGSIDTGGTAPLYGINCPIGNDNPLMPLAFTANFCNSARIDLSRCDAGAPGTPKAYRLCEVWANGLGTARWGLVYYTLDGGTRTLLGTVNTSPRSLLFFPSGDTSSSFVQGQDIELSLESYIAAGHEATSPVYRSVVLRSRILAPSVDTIEALVPISDGLQDRYGGQMRSGDLMIKELRDLAASPRPVELVDLAGATSIVTVIPPVEEEETYQEGDRLPMLVARLKMAVMDFTAN